MKRAREASRQARSVSLRTPRSAARRGDMPRPLIIGYGNSLRGDDALGPRLAAMLGGIALQQLVPELAERLAREERAIFIDARADLAPGEVRIMPVNGESASTHFCSPGWLLRLAQDTYGHAPDAMLVGIGAQSFEFGAPLSAAARAGLKKARSRIRAMAFAPAVSDAPRFPNGAPRVQ